MSETTCSSLLRWSKLRRSRMLFDESNEQLGKQLSFHSRSFFYFNDFFSITLRVKRYYTSYFHLRLFVWESLIFLILFSLVTLSGTNVKGMFCFQKVSCSFSLISSFLLLPRFHFPWMKLTLLFYETKILDKLVYDLLK